MSYTDYKYTAEDFFKLINDKDITVKAVVDYFEDENTNPGIINFDKKLVGKIDALLCFFYYIKDNRLPLSEKKDEEKRYTQIRNLDPNSAKSTWAQNAKTWLTGNGDTGGHVLEDILAKYIKYNKTQGHRVTEKTSSVKFINYIIEFLRSNKYPYVNEKAKKLADTLEEIIDGNYQSVANSTDNVDAIVAEAIEKSKKKQIIFTGAPGTGKTYCVEKYVKEMTKEKELNGEKSRFVQFHSSYDYTDFVEGLRPVIFCGETEFIRLDGTFKEFCRKIIVDNVDFIKNRGSADDLPDYYFVIDEINRADLGKVFGELMYCFEKRGEEHKVKTQYANLPEYTIKDKKVVPAGNEFADGFYIPENLIILCTMNDIDRSVETFDFALRRRFDWVEINADEIMESSLESILGDKYSKSVLDCANAVNKIIADENHTHGLGKEYQIGPAYFKDYDGKNIKLDSIWNNNIEPILKEYLRGRSSCQLFVDECKSAFDKAKSGGIENE